MPRPPLRAGAARPTPSCRHRHRTAPQSVLIYDMEAYSTDDPPAGPACWRSSVRGHAAARPRVPVRLLQQHGLRRGRPGRQLRDPGYVRPDYLDFARWDTVATLTDPAIPAGYWAPQPTDEAVPRRSQRDVRRGHHQHRQRLRGRRPDAGGQAGRLQRQRLVRRAGPDVGPATSTSTRATGRWTTAPAGWISGGWNGDERASSGSVTSTATATRTSSRGRPPPAACGSIPARHGAGRPQADRQGWNACGRSPRSAT